MTISHIFDRLSTGALLSACDDAGIEVTRKGLGPGSPYFYSGRGLTVKLGPYPSLRAAALCACKSLNLQPAEVVEAEPHRVAAE